MKKLLISLCLLLVVGCQSAALSEGDYGGQGLRAEFVKAPVPATVVTTYADGTQTVATVSPAGTPVIPIVSKAPVVQVTVVPAQPGVTVSYTVTPEIQKGLKAAASRVMTWAGEAPGTVAEKIATQRQSGTHNPLPAVSIDETGIHATAGGGSTQTQAGQSYWQRARVWLSDLFKGWSMWLLVLGIGLAVIFVLPLFIPALAPIMASLWKSILTVVGWIWDVIERIIKWFEDKMKKPTPPTPPTPPATGPISEGVK